MAAAERTKRKPGGSGLQHMCIRAWVCPCVWWGEGKAGTLGGSRVNCAMEGGSWALESKGCQQP